jgi:hypothetical protein
MLGGVGTVGLTRLWITAPMGEGIVGGGHGGRGEPQALGQRAPGGRRRREGGAGGHVAHSAHGRAGSVIFLINENENQNQNPEEGARGWSGFWVSGRSK